MKGNSVTKLNNVTKFKEAFAIVCMNHDGLVSDGVGAFGPVRDVATGCVGTAGPVDPARDVATGCVGVAGPVDRTPDPSLNSHSNEWWDGRQAASHKPKLL